MDSFRSVRASSAQGGNLYVHNHYHYNGDAAGDDFSARMLAIEANLERLLSRITQLEQRLDIRVEQPFSTFRPDFNTSSTRKVSMALDNDAAELQKQLQELLIDTGDGGNEELAKHIAIGLRPWAKVIKRHLQDDENDVEVMPTGGVKISVSPATRKGSAVLSPAANTDAKDTAQDSPTTNTQGESFKFDVEASPVDASVHTAPLIDTDPTVSDKGIASEEKTDDAPAEEPTAD